MSTNTYKKRRVNSLDKRFGELIELAGTGLTHSEIALRMEVTVNSLYNFLSRNPDRREKFNEVKARATRDLVESGLIKLGQGYCTREKVLEYIEERDGKVVKVKEKVTELAPNVKALEALGNKYCPGEFRQVDRSEQEVKLKITSEHRALSFEEKLGILMREKNGGKILEVKKGDYKVKDGIVELSEEIKKNLD